MFQGEGHGIMKKALTFNGFTPVQSSYELGALLPDRGSAESLCSAINGLSSGWTVEEMELSGARYWRVVWLGE
jgi:hypothetical protein